MTSNLRKSGYKERCEAQMVAWVAGDFEHNTVDDECCPDFSCCSQQRTPLHQREAFAAASDRDRETILMTFLSRGIERMGQGDKVHVAGRI